MKKLPLLLACVATLSLSLPALAERPSARDPVRLAQADGAQQPKKRKKLSPEKRKQLEEQVRKKVSAYMTAELSRRLSLDEDKAAKLAVVIERHQERRDERHGRFRAELRKLRDLLENKAPDDQLLAQIERVREARAVRDEMERMLEESARFLSAEEQARLTLAYPRVMRDVRKMMREAREERRKMRRSLESQGAGE